FDVQDTGEADAFRLYLHDALPICNVASASNVKSSSSSPKITCNGLAGRFRRMTFCNTQTNSLPANSLAKTACQTIACNFWRRAGERKSTRLNSSHDQISYAVFCLK